MRGVSSITKARPRRTGIAAAAGVVLVGEDGRTVCRRCSIAGTPLRRLRGLLGRRRLLPGEGLVIVPCSSVHTWFMRFPIDVVFLDDEDRVLTVVEAVKPWRAIRHRGAKTAVELAAGEARRRRIQPGERLGWGELQARVNGREQEVVAEEPKPLERQSHVHARPAEPARRAGGAAE